MTLPVSYSLRSLWVRRATTLAAVGSVALVVFVLASSQMLATGLQQTLAVSGAPDRAIVLQQSVTAEAYSRLKQSVLNVAAGAPGVRHDAEGKPMVTGESSVPIMLSRSDKSGKIISVFVRGITSESLELRTQVRVIEGRLPKLGSEEAMVGRNLMGRFTGLTVGGNFEINAGRKIAIVGVFDAGGTAFESEIWADREAVRTALKWTGYLGSVTAQLDSPEAFEKFAADVKLNTDDAAVALRESEYYSRLSRGLSGLFVGLGSLVALIFSFGAMLGAAITMYSSMSQRTREVGVFRAIGFQRGDILGVFLLEAAALSLAGALLGIGCALLTTFGHLSTVNGASGTEITFQFIPTIRTLLVSFAAGAGIGILGGFFPAVSAARLNPLQAIRG